VLRVSAATARLLHPPGDGRAATKRHVAKIYKLRSRVVHGEDVDRNEVNAASSDALRYALGSMRALIRDRVDLVPLTSGERSTRLLLE
jgi:hypothetical protein